MDYDGSATVGNVRSVVSFQLQAAAADAHVQTATGFGPGAVSLFAADGLLPLGAASLPNREFVFLLTYQSAGYTFGQAPVGPVGLNYSYTLTFEVAPAPLPNVAEPPSGLLAALGLAALGRWRRLRPLRAA